VSFLRGKLFVMIQSGTCYYSDKSSDMFVEQYTGTYCVMLTEAIMSDSFLYGIIKQNLIIWMNSVK